jgi:hypothetical protein
MNEAKFLNKKSKPGKPKTIITKILDLRVLFI